MKPIEEKTKKRTTNSRQTRHHFNSIVRFHYLFGVWCMRICIHREHRRRRSKRRQQRRFSHDIYCAI